MKGPLHFRNAGPEGVRVTIGPVWAEMTKEEALAMWQKLGQELGILCDDHRLNDEVLYAKRCSRCEQLVEMVKPSK